MTSHVVGATVHVFVPVHTHLPLAEELIVRDLGTRREVATQTPAQVGMSVLELRRPGHAVGLISGNFILQISPRPQTTHYCH